MKIWHSPRDLGWYLEFFPWWPWRRFWLVQSDMIDFHALKQWLTEFSSHFSTFAPNPVGD